MLIILSTVTGYLFLWVRQRVLYVHPVLVVLNGKRLSIVSYVVLSAWLILTVGLVVSGFILLQYEYYEHVGCVIRKANRKHLIGLFLSFVFIGSFIQVLLVALFIYPIVKQSNISIHFFGKKNVSRSSSRAGCLVKKSIILSTACLVFNIAWVIFPVLVHRNEKGNSIFSYGICLTINVILIICYFDYWKLLLWHWPCYRSINRVEIFSMNLVSVSVIKNKRRASSPF